MLTPLGMERQLLTSLHDAMAQLIERLDTRLGALALPASEERELPIPGYDEMKAKDVVAAIAELPLAQVLAVYEYEQRTKNRVTVLRAAEARQAS